MAKTPDKKKDPLAAALSRSDDKKAAASKADAKDSQSSDKPAAKGDPLKEALKKESAGKTSMKEAATSAGGDLKARNSPDGEANKAPVEAAPAPAAPPKKRAEPAMAAALDRPVQAPRPSASPEHDAAFVERARRREDKARKAQAKDEARRMRTEAKKMLKEARQKEKSQQVLEAHMEKVSGIGEDLGYDPERPITRIPDLPPHLEEVSFRVIQDDRAFIRLAYDTEMNQHIYEVIEPTLTPNEEKIMAFLRDTLIRTLDGRRGRDVDWAEYLREAVTQAIVDHDILVDHISTERILYYLIRDFLGFGPIDVLMQDDQLEDISCDGPNIPIYIFHRQYESIRTTIMFDEDLEIDSYVIRLAQRSGKHISIADPLLDATLPDGSRLQATLSREVTTRGSSFTVRKFRDEPFTPPDLINYKTVTTPMCAYFWFIMEEGRSLIYAGGTASGKTTSLNAWCQFIPPEKKIVSIEDTREINLLQENWIAGVTRSGFGAESISGKRAGTIDMYRLLEAALRQRPEYLLVGEVRGAEALTLFQAMATGHAVYSTMHADSPKSAVYRLENPPINVPRMMLQTLDVITIQAQVKVGKKMTRRVRDVVEIVGFDPDNEDLLTNTVFTWDASTDKHHFTGHSNVFDEIQEKKGWTREEFQKEWEQRMLVLEWMRHTGVNHFREFSKIVHEYYKRPERLLGRIKDDGFTLDEEVAMGARASGPSAHAIAAAETEERIPKPHADEPAPWKTPSQAAHERESKVTTSKAPWKEAAEADADDLAEEAKKINQALDDDDGTQ